MANHDAERYAELQNDLKLVLQVYEKHLAKQKYLVKDDVMSVDLFHLPTIRALKKFPDAIPALKDLPNAARWWKALDDIPLSTEVSYEL